MFAAFGVVLVVLCLIVLAVVLALFSLLSKKEDASQDSGEAHTIQELYRTLERLEKRTEVLETLLIEQRYSADHSFEDNLRSGDPRGRK